MKFLQGYSTDKDALAKWKMVCIHPQAHKLRVGSHSKLSCSSEATKAQFFMAAFHDLHLHTAQVLESPCCFTLEKCVAPCWEHLWRRILSISSPHQYPVPSHPQPLWRCPPIAKPWGSSAGGKSWCKPALRSKDQIRVALGNAFWLSLVPKDGSGGGTEKNHQAKRKQDI